VSWDTRLSQNYYKPVTSLHFILWISFKILQKIKNPTKTNWEMV